MGEALVLYTQMPFCELKLMDLRTSRTNLQYSGSNKSNTHRKQIHSFQGARRMTFRLISFAAPYDYGGRTYSVSFGEPRGVIENPDMPLTPTKCSRGIRTATLNPAFVG